jgi:hypothetical protein
MKNINKQFQRKLGTIDDEWIHMKWPTQLSEYIKSDIKKNGFNLKDFIVFEVFDKYWFGIHIKGIMINQDGSSNFVNYSTIKDLQMPFHNINKMQLNSVSVYFNDKELVLICDEAGAASVIYKLIQFGIKNAGSNKSDDSPVNFEAH